MNHTFNLEVELPNRPEPINIEVDVEYSWENDGIGAYEYWGAKGYDHGTNYVAIDDCKWNSDSYTREEIAIVEDEILKSHKFWIEQIEDVSDFDVEIVDDYEENY